MPRRTEDSSTTVPPAQQVEAAHPLWRCAKPCVWTSRMLTALIQGAEGAKWFRLYDKVFAERNLLAAFQQVAAKKGAAGVDRARPTAGSPADDDRRRPRAVVDRRQREPDAPRLVRVLPARQSSLALQRPGRVAAHALAKSARTSTRRSRRRAQSTGLVHLAESLLRRSRAVQSGNRPCRGLSILTKVKPSTGEPDAGDPHVRFGGRGAPRQWGVPTPIRGVRFTARNGFLAPPSVQEPRPPAIFCSDCLVNQAFSKFSTRGRS